MQEYIKHSLVRTPLEVPSQKLKSIFSYVNLIKHPEQREVCTEHLRINHLMQRLVSKSANCLDVGAHLGSVLSQIVRLAPEGQHLAVEALPYKAEWLTKKFPEVDIRQLALTDKEGEIEFYLNKRATGFSGLRPSSYGNAESFKKILVKCSTLDLILPPERQIDFIKIDVEGAELSVFKGAKNTLNKYHPPILFECTKSAIASFEVSPGDIFNYLTQQHGYSVYLIKSFLNNGQPLTYEEFFESLNYPFKAFNFLAK